MSLTSTISRTRNVSKAEPDRWNKNRTLALLREYHRTRDNALRDEIFGMNVNLVKYVAARFAERGEPMEDLVQVGCVGLVKAIERFDPHLQTQFTTYAIPTILGEIKRYFRDKTWSLKVPRGLQNLMLSVSRATETLMAQLGRPPAVQELADALEVSQELVLEALELGQSYNSRLSLDSEFETEKDDKRATLATFLGAPDGGLDNVNDQLVVEQALAQLPNRERLIVHLRFYQNYSQKEVAEVLGISQMHVSRLQTKALSSLQKALHPVGGRKQSKI